MNQSFVSNKRLVTTFLNDYQSTILQHRIDVVDVWRHNNLPYVGNKGFSATEPSPFLIDKYSFRIWLTKIGGVPEHVTTVPEDNFEQLFGLYDETVRASVVGSKTLGTEAPCVTDCVRRSQFLEDLFLNWRQHLSGHGINLPKEVIDWYFSVPLLEVYRNSVFYPRFPVLWGPNYFGRISDSDRHHILSRYGQGAVWDFYFFMMVCHEQSHFIQKGEPILNEIAHAILWIDFVLARGLQPFQINSETGKTSNIEAPFILDRVGKLRSLNFRLMFEDNLKFFEHEVSGVPYSYFVAMTFLVHMGVLRYRYVVNLFCGLLAREEDVSQYLRKEAESHLEFIIQNLRASTSKSHLRGLIKSHMPSFGNSFP